jgi:hypothetical protein
MINSKNTPIGRSWTGSLVSFIPQLVGVGDDELIWCLKGSLRSRPVRRPADTTSGATSWCKYPHFVACHRWRAASLILLVVSWNTGKGRIVYPLVMERPMKVHRSVRTRISAQGWDGEKGRYLPAVRCTIKGEKEPRCLKREEWLADKPEHFEWVD